MGQLCAGNVRIFIYEAMIKLFYTTLPPDGSNLNSLHHLITALTSVH